MPEQYSDYHVLAEYLKEKNQWKKLYFSNADGAVYNDKEAAGVIMRDESLTPYDGLFPVEFASRVMRDKNDEKDCLKLFDAFTQGHVNKHCSLHQHLSNEGFDLDVYKRLVKRMMQHEDEIVGAFVAAAVENNPHHVNRFLLNKYTWYNNESSDDKTVMHELRYGYDFVPHDSYRPMKRAVSESLVRQ